jgi:hypothetical protein
VHLALGRTCADRAPRDQVCDELWCDGVQEFADTRHADREQVEQEPARDAQAGVDGEAAIEPGIVDQALPAERGPRLLEVDSHHDQQRITMSFCLRCEPSAVVDRGDRVMDRAWPDHHQQSVITAFYDVARAEPRLCDNGAALVDRGISSSRMPAGISGRMFSIRRSSVTCSGMLALPPSRAFWCSPNVFDRAVTRNLVRLGVSAGAATSQHAEGGCLHCGL